MAQGTTSKMDPYIPVLCPACEGQHHDSCHHLFSAAGEELIRCVCTGCSAEQVREAERRYQKVREAAFERLKKKGMP